MPAAPASTKIAFTAVGESFDNPNCTCISNIQDITYSTSQTITGCNIVLQNVIIQNNSNVMINARHDITIGANCKVQENSNLIIKAAGNVTVEKDFDVQVGSTIEIQ